MSPDKCVLLSCAQIFVQHTRRDVHAERYWDSQKKKWGYKPVHAPIDTDRLHGHLNDGPHLGAYFIAPDSSVTRVGALDLDDHERKLGWDTMRKVAGRLRDLASKFGLEAWPVRSGGGAGIHLLLRWDADQQAAAVREQLLTLITALGFKEGSSNGGIANSEIEIFPKQPSVAAGSFGNLLAIPFGRASVPLGHDLQPTSSPLTWNLSAPVPPVQAEHISHSDVDADPNTVREALKTIPADDRYVWIRIGLALKNSLGEIGYGLWAEWSHKSAKYPGESELREDWDGFKPRRTGVTLGTVFFLARENGWQPPKQDSTDLPFADFKDVLATEVFVPSFPADALPEPFCRYIKNMAENMQVQSDFIGGPMLAVAATMVGRNFWIWPQGDPTWAEPSIFWIACIGESGSMKSPASKQATKFVWKLQLELNDDYKEERMKWLTRDDADKKPGDEPKLESCYVADATVESLKFLLSDDHNANPRGLLYNVDELLGWLSGMDQYKAKGNDRQFFLSLHDGSGVRVDRKKDGDPTIIPRPNLSICGGVQPAILQKMFREGDDGLTPRFQVVWPLPQGEVRPRTVAIDQQAWKDVADRLRSIRKAEPISDPDKELADTYFGEPLRFSDEAQPTYDDWVLASRNRRESNVFGAYIGKQRGFLARLSMILHGMEYGSGMGSKAISLDTLRRAMKLVDYFEAHTRKLYGVIDGHPARAGALRIAQWIKMKKRATFTARDIRQHDWAEFRKERDEDSIRASLLFLEAHGWLRLEESLPGKKGGRPTFRAHVNPLAHT